ncbi:MAG: DUF5684 domain-containing protein [bacterium]|nr:DUF5684 domain-containing protein [bacterium]
MDYSTTDGAASAGLLAMIIGFGAIFLFFGLLAYLFYGYCIGRIFQKAGKPLWAGFIPIYNWVVLIEIIGKPMWWVAVVLAAFIVGPMIPIIGIFIPWAMMVFLGIELAKVFGKDTVFGVLTGLFWFVMIPVLAFGDAQYQGAQPASDQMFSS